MWAQQNVVDEDGYAAFATSAAKDPAAAECDGRRTHQQIVTLAANSGYDVQPDLLSGAAAAYTRSAGFPGQFAQANRIVHRWMFTDDVQKSDASGRWQIDLSPMLADSSFQETLGDLGLDAPSTLMVPLTGVRTRLRPGQLRQVARWGPWASVGAAI